MTKRRKKSVKERNEEKEEKFYSSRDQVLDEENEHTESSEDFIAKMRKGEKDEDVYSEEGIEEELEDDGVANWEAGFMHGELNATKYDEKKEEKALILPKSLEKDAKTFAKKIAREKHAKKKKKVAKKKHHQKKVKKKR